MNKNNKTIFFAAGGTAGHIAPALAAAEALEQISSDYRIVFVTNKYSPRNKKADSNGFEETFSISGVLLGGKNYVVETLDCIGLPAGFSLKYFVFVLKLFKSFFRSLALIKKHHPSAIAAFGGYLSFPIVTAAWLSGLPVLIHEQNVMPGRVNRLLFRFVSICALSFEDSRKYFDLERGKNLIEKIISLFLKENQPAIVVAGMPVRKQMEVTGESDKSKFSILVMGGSQGAHYLNKVFLAALKELGPAIQKKLHVIHLSGTRDLDEIKEAYKSLDIDSHIYGFLKEMSEVYKSCDLVICRAGASCLTELSYYGCAAVLIPYPYARGHQLKNAEYFTDRKAAIMLEQKELTPEKLKQIIIDLMNNPDKIKSLSDNIKTILPADADEVLAKRINSML